MPATQNYCTVKFGFTLILAFVTLAYILFARFRCSNPEALNRILEVLGSFLLLIIAGGVFFLYKEKEH